jgi:hypothetical protein
LRTWPTGAKNERFLRPAVESGMHGLKIHRAKVALVLFAAFLIWLVCLADTGHLPRIFALVQWIPWGDKLGHLVLFGILAFLVNLRFRAGETRLGPFTVLKGSTLVAAAVSLEECSQLFFPSRTFDLVDLAADFVGIWLAGRLAVLYLASKVPAAEAGFVKEAMPARIQDPHGREGNNRFPPAE